MNVPHRTIVHFIRHGDALPDEDATFTGSAGYDDLGLSAVGRSQARALGERLAASTNLAAVYASPTRRAYETAAAVGAASDLEIGVDARLREIHLGDESFPAHLTTRERIVAIRKRLAGLATVALRDGSWAAIQGAEPIEAVRDRVVAAVADVVRAHPGAHVALVSHAGAINAYFAAILGVARPFFFPTGNASLSSVRVEGDERLVLRLNDTAHLETLVANTRYR